MNLTPERKAENKIAARWGGNVARLVKEKKLKLCDLGRLLDPDNAAPSNVAFILTHRHTMPDDRTCCIVASFLGVSKESLHAGELWEVKQQSRSVPCPSSVVGTGDVAARRVQSPELGKQDGRRRLDSSHFRRDRRPGRGEVKGQKSKGKGQNAEAEGTTGEGEDELYGFVLDAVRGRAGALIEPERGEFVRKLARLCREYER